jgi:hypothetical protein
MKKSNTFGVASCIIALIPYLTLPYDFFVSQVGAEVGKASPWFAYLDAYGLFVTITSIILAFTFSYKQNKIKESGFAVAGFVLALLSTIAIAYTLIVVVRA